MLQNNNHVQHHLLLNVDGLTSVRWRHAAFSRSTQTCCYHGAKIKLFEVWTADCIFKCFVKLIWISLFRVKFESCCFSQTITVGWNRECGRHASPRGWSRPLLPRRCPSWRQPGPPRSYLENPTHKRKCATVTPGNEKVWHFLIVIISIYLYLWPSIHAVKFWHYLLLSVRFPATKTLKNRESISVLNKIILKTFVVVQTATM